MKKILAVTAAIFAMTISVSVSAADITFTPEGGGKWIFCNNPEAIHNDDLMNSDEYEPAYIMNNENLEPDLYDFLICHINSTDTEDGYGMGFNIELDVELTAVKDCEITINKAFFDTPTDEAFIYSDGTWAKETNKFSCLRGLTSYLGVNLTELNGSWLYEAQPYESVTIEIKKGETVWLSDYMDGYTAVKYGKPVQIMGELSVNYGVLNFNVAAFKSGDELGDRSSFDPDAAFGAYSYTRTQKGIADSLPKVNVDLEYSITSSMKDGDYFSNKVYNQYQPDGYVTTAWCSHLSPQDDIWSKSIAVESDLLTLTYEDDSKLDYYGSKVKSKNKNNVWTWDPYHSDTAAYPNSSTWYSAEDYEPNYELSVKRNNEGYACSMGNYGVIECYNLKVTNATSEDKYFEYVTETASSIAVYVVDEDGAHSGFLKGENNPATKDTMASVLIPANSEKEFSINMVLPINYVGGIRNSFQVYSESSMGKTYEDYLNEPRAAEGPITTGILASDVEDELPQEVKDIIRGNYDSFELVETDTGYMLRWIEWDGCPYYYTTHWDMVKNIYYLDEDYNIVDRYAFDKLIQLAVYYDGCYYVEDADGVRYKSEDGQSWESYAHRLPLPNITFEDNEPSDWAEDEVIRAYALDVAPYQLKDTLVYTDNMTRKTFCDVLASMLELRDMLPEEGDAEFTDSTSTNVLLLGSAGIISGYDDGSFRPQNSITREEAAVLLYKTALYMGYEDLSEAEEDLSKALESLDDEDSDEDSEDESEKNDEDLTDDEDEYVYSDDSDISGWAKDAVYEMNKLRVMSGVGDDEFAPKSTYTNEQSIVTILRLYDAV